VYSFQALKVLAAIRETLWGTTAELSKSSALTMEEAVAYANMNYAKVVEMRDNFLKGTSATDKKTFSPEKRSQTKPLVVITGATSGIGMQVAKDFSAKGHALLLIGRRVDRMTSLGLPNTLCEGVDVTDLAAFKAAVAKAEGQFGPVHCIVNNAGVMLLSPIDTQDPAEWTTMINVNITGVLNGINSVIKGMKERKDGHIFNISSIAGVKHFPNHTAYCGTKLAVHAITEGTRQECAESGVRVTVIAPGAVETELLSHTTSDEIKKGYGEWKQGMDDGVLMPEDVSAAIQYAYSQPRRCNVREIQLHPLGQVP